MYLLTCFTLEFACLHNSMIVGVFIKCGAICERFVALFADPGFFSCRHGIFRALMTAQRADVYETLEKCFTI